MVKDMRESISNSQYTSDVADKMNQEIDSSDTAILRKLQKLKKLIVQFKITKLQRLKFCQRTRTMFYQTLIVL